MTLNNILGCTMFSMATSAFLLLVGASMTTVFVTAILIGAIWPFMTEGK